MADFWTEPRFNHSHSKSEFLINVYIRNHPESPDQNASNYFLVFRGIRTKNFKQRKLKKNATVKMVVFESTHLDCWEVCQIDVEEIPKYFLTVRTNDMSGGVST